MQNATGKRHLLGTPFEAFAAYCAEQNLPGFRARQVYEWVYRKGAASFDEMTNLGRELREQLSRDWDIYTSRIARRQESTDGTVKLLLEWPDGATSECVMIPDADRRTACISSQVGCPVGCRFCASGLSGLQRQLTTGQIIEQAMRVRQVCEFPHRVAPQPAAPVLPIVTPEPEPISRDDAAIVRRGRAPQVAAPAAAPRPNPASRRASEPQRLSNIVFMGLGEPLGNYAAVLAAIRIINAEWGMNIGARKITVSTVGLPSQIRRLAGEDLQINLALSLHAPNDALRQELIPWAERISIAELTDAVRYYFDKTGREATLEYILLGGVNDGPEHANELVSLCRKMRCNVNLIRYNPVAGLGYERPKSFASQKFLQRLRERGVNAHLRKSRGMDIDAACGQLRRAEMLQSRQPVG